MVKFDAVAVNRMNSYFASTAYERLNVVEAMNQVTSKKKKYDYESMLFFLINSISKMLESGNCTQKKLDKYFCLIKQIGSVERKDYEFDELSISTYSLIPDAYKKFSSLEGKEFDQKYYDQIIKIGESIGVKFDRGEVSDNAAAKIVELDKRVDELTKENAKLKRDLEIALKDLKKANISQDSLNGRLSSEINGKLERISELEREITTLSEKLRQTEDTLSQRENTIIRYETILKEKERLLKDVNSELTKTKNDLAKSEEKRSEIMRSSAYIIGRNTIANREIDEIVLGILVKGYVTADAILESLQTVNGAYTLKDVYDSLKRISTRFAIENSKVVNVPRLYGISRYDVDVDKTVKLPVKGNVKKMIFVSDFHIDPLDDPKYLESKMDSLQAYALSNDIDTFVNLGDVFNTKEKQLAGESEFDKVMAVFDESTSYLANNQIFAPEINHLILGGNHDISITKFGIDPISILADKIPSIIPIGYHTAKLVIGDNKNNQFGLHHSGAPRQDSVKESEFVGRVVSYLENYYGRTSKNRDTKFDFLGHIHSGVIEPTNKFAVVPSLLRDRVCDGALEVNIYFDANNEIEYMALFPLVCPNNRETRRILEVPIVR